jgi:nucleoid-associated protein YgaU
MSRPVLIGIIGLLVLLVAGTLNLWLFPQDDAEETTAGSPPSSASSSDSSSGTAPASKGGGETATASGDAQPMTETQSSEAAGSSTGSSTADATGTDATGTDTGPSFDTVRVDPEGNTVIAGRGKPNATISILDGDTEIGSVTSDGRGEWVFIPQGPLAAGESVIRLVETDANGETRDSDAAVVLVIPEKGKDIAGNASDTPSTPLAVLVPKDEGGTRAAATVLQAPEAPAPQTATSQPETSQPETSQPTETAQAGTDSASAPAAADKAAADQTSQETSEGTVQKADDETQTTASAKPTVTGTDGVTVDVIDYDESGSVVFTGKSEPGSKVEVIIDGKSLGTVEADTGGTWSLTPKEAVPPGSYDLVVNKVAADGVVEARVALPFVRAGALDRLPQDRFIVIQPGTNLWTIALRVYGEGTRYVQIHQANSDQIRDPDLIFPGQVFSLPPRPTD